MPRLGDHHRQAGFLLVLANPEVGGTLFAADLRIGVVVDGPEIERRVGRRATRDDGSGVFAGVVGIASVENPAHHRVGLQVVGIGVASGHGAQGDKVADALLAPLDQIVVTGIEAVVRISRRHDHRVEVRVNCPPTGIQRRDIAAVNQG